MSNNELDLVIRARRALVDGELQAVAVGVREGVVAEIAGLEELSAIDEITPVMCEV